MHHPDSTAYSRSWRLQRFRQVGLNKMTLQQFSRVKTFVLHHISSWTLAEFPTVPHNVLNAQLWRFKGWKPIWSKWAVTRLMSVTKVDFDCQSLFCLLVGERTISIALTVHQSFRNWILVQSGFHPRSDWHSSITYSVKAEAQYTLSALWHIPASLDYGDRKIKSLSLENFTADIQAKKK